MPVVLSRGVNAVETLPVIEQRALSAVGPTDSDPTDAAPSQDAAWHTSIYFSTIHSRSTGRNSMKYKSGLVAIALVAGLGLAGCGSSNTAETSSSAPAQTDGSDATPTESSSKDSLFCEGLVTINKQADSLVESVSQENTVRAAAGVTKDLALLAGQVQTVAELETSTNAASLRAAGKKFENDLDRIDLKSSQDARAASATAAADTFQTSLSSIASSAQCASSTTDQLK